MKNEYQLQAKNPCSENWEVMTPNEQGRFCARCQKTVIDFTNMTSIEIAYFLDLSYNKDRDLCGRITQSQLQQTYTAIKPSAKQSPVKQYIVALLSGSFLLSSCHSSDTLSQEMELKLSVEQNKIKGLLTDKKSHYPIKHATFIWFDAATYQKNSHYYREIEGQKDFLLHFRCMNSKYYDKETIKAYWDSVSIAEKWLKANSHIKTQAAYTYKGKTDEEGIFWIEIPNNIQKTRFEVNLYEDKDTSYKQNLRKPIKIQQAETFTVDYDNHLQNWQQDRLICSETAIKKPKEIYLGGLYSIQQRNNISEMISDFEKNNPYPPQNL